MKNFFCGQHPRIALIFGLVFLYVQPAWAQQPAGELEDVQIEIVRDRQITIPKASRNFEKVPARTSEPIKPPIQYDFRAFKFQTPQIKTAVRPLKLQDQNASKTYGGYLSGGYGNYASPYLEGFITSNKDKKKLVGAHGWLASSGRGPVDGRNSGSGMSGLSVFAKTFGQDLAFSADAGFENRSTHFYGYTPGTDVDQGDIRQSYNQFHLSGEISNTRKSDFSYKLGAAFSHLSDKFDARETDVDLFFGAGYQQNETKAFKLDASFNILNRQDNLIDAKARTLFTVRPRYEFELIEDLKFSAGIVVALENDTIDNKNVHAYPDIRASYPLSPSVDIVASLTGGVEKVSLHSLSRENIWLDANVPIFHTNKLYDLTGALHTRIGNKVSVNGGFSFASLKNMYFYVNNPADQSRFQTVYDRGSTMRTNFFASIGYVQSEKSKFLLRGDLFGYSTDEVASAWHRPRHKVTGEASLNVYDKVVLNLSLISMGGMKALDPTNGETVSLDNAFDLNARVEYIFSDSFSFFVRFNNITSNEYPLFLNYPVRGFQVLGGLTWSF